MRRSRWVRIHRSSLRSDALRHEIAPAHEVVRGRAKAKLPIDETPPTVTQFAKQRHGLQPTERLLNELPFAMTEPIARVSGRAGIDRTAAVSEIVLRDVRCDAHLSHGRDPGVRVVRLVGG